MLSDLGNGLGWRYVGLQVLYDIEFDLTSSLGILMCCGVLLRGGLGICE